MQETTYKGVVIPEGFSPTGIDGEDTIDEGLVITDSTGNEYVWIEVPNDGSGPNYTGVEVNNTINTSKIYTAIVNYCKKDLNGNTLISTAAKDVWYDSAGKKTSNSSNLNDDSVCGLTSAQYTELYKKMLTSIYKNGGFWISRYEAGSTFPRRSSNDSIEGIKPMSKQNLYPINYVSCSQAQTLASTVLTNEKYSSSVMFGIQWDLVIKFLSNKGVETELLNVDSNSWGNYYGTSFKIDRGQYSISNPWNIFNSYKIPSEDNQVIVVNNISTKNKIDNRAVLLTTGASERNKKMNIYDFAGNLSEFTLQMVKYTSTKTCNYYRGGATCNEGLDSFNVAGKVCFDYDNMSAWFRGFRISIY